jgi:hypothetical protein
VFNDTHLELAVGVAFMVVGATFSRGRGPNEASVIFMFGILFTIHAAIRLWIVPSMRA